MHIKLTDQFTGKRLPGLDGWRGIAMILVLLGHFRFLLLGSFGTALAGWGQHGVTIFFVLSGYLITTNLVERGANLKTFYLRRFFRLMPAAWAYLLFLALIQVAFRPSFSTTAGATSAIFFYRNMSGVPNEFNGHFWSLSLEEQFYFVWPITLLFLGKRWAVFAALTAATAFALYRFLHWGLYDRVGSEFLIPARADALFVGCSLALILQHPKCRERIAQFSPFAIVPASVLITYCIFHFHYLVPFSESICIAILIAATVTAQSGLYVKVLSWRPLVSLGVISYSVYLWQQFFVPFHNLAFLMVGLPTIAVLSFYLIERPGMQLGSRFTAWIAESPSLDADRAKQIMRLSS